MSDLIPLAADATLQEPGAPCSRCGVIPPPGQAFYADVSLSLGTRPLCGLCRVRYIERLKTLIMACGLIGVIAGMILATRWRNNEWLVINLQAIYLFEPLCV